VQSGHPRSASSGLEAHPTFRSLAQWNSRGVKASNVKSSGTRGKNASPRKRN
jgi:hypothetical protein